MGNVKHIQGVQKRAKFHKLLEDPAVISRTELEESELEVENY